MAPEVLNKEKYKKEADIFSFAVTMYECFGWQEAYPSSEFKFSWKIADFVIKGGRMQKTDEMTHLQYDLISQSWCQDPKKRLQIDAIVSRLDFLYTNWK